MKRLQVLLALALLGLLAACVPNPVDLAVDQAIEAGLRRTAEVLPQNALPFSDDFESYPVGAILTRANPESYRLWGDCDGRLDYAFVVETVGPEGRSEKAAAVEYPCGGGGGLHALTTGAEDWRDYRAEVSFRTKDDQWWVYLNISGNGAHAYVLEVYGTSATLYKQIGKERTVVARRDVSGPRADDAWHTLVAEARSDGVRVTVDGEVFADYTDGDPAFSHGGFGIQASRYGRRMLISRWSFAPLP
ncbi:family 16 glycoside hydrolase [Oceanithermus sp.]